MSWRATSWAKQVVTGSPAKKAVLMIIAEHADQWGYAWAGQQLIADEAEVNIRTVQRHVSDLDAAGFLTIYQARGRDGARHNLYRLGFDAMPKDPMPEEHPSQTGKYVSLHNRSGAEPRDNLSCGPGDNLSCGHTTPGAEPHDNEREATRHLVSYEPIGTDSEPSADGVGPLAAEGGGPGVVPLENRKTWIAILDRMRGEFGGAAVESWIKPLSVIADNEEVVLGARSAFVRDWVVNHYGRRLGELWGRSVTIVVVGSQTEATS